MTTDEAEAFLTSIRPEGADVVAEVGRRKDVAYLRLSSSSEPARWAVVHSPGDRWFSLEVDGGFSLDYFEEDLPAEDVAELLKRYAAIGLDYLDQLPSPEAAGVLRRPVVKICRQDGLVVLHRSVSTNLKSLFGTKAQ